MGISNDHRRHGQTRGVIREGCRPPSSRSFHIVNSVDISAVSSSSSGCLSSSILGVCDSTGYVTNSGSLKNIVTSRTQAKLNYHLFSQRISC